MRQEKIEAKQLLKDAGLRPTRQRLSLACLLFAADHRHITAEQLHVEAVDADISVSLATIYNTLNQFTDAGLLREVVVEAGRSYFDTNVSDHHHLYHENTGQLQDIPEDSVTVSALPNLPDAYDLSRVDVIIRVKDKH